MVLVYIVCAGGVLDCLVFWQGLSLSACYPMEESTTTSVLKHSIESVSVLEVY